MKKLMKPLAALFLVAIASGAYAQQELPGRKLKSKMVDRHIPAQQIQRNKTKVKAMVVQNREADIQRIVRKKGLTVAQVK